MTATTDTEAPELAPGNRTTLGSSILLGAASILSRQITLRFFAFAANIFLARRLGPTVFGLYAILNFIISGPFGLIGSLGFNISLVRKLEPPEERDTGTVLIVQIAVLLVIALCLIALHSEALAFYAIDSRYASVLFWLFLALILRSVRTVPTALMERALRFGELSVIEVVEWTGYYGLLLYLAFAEYGLWSLVWATLLKELLGCTLLLRCSNWWPSFAFDTGSFKQLARVGLPYQASGLLNLLSLSFPALVIGSVLGATELGYVGWAYNLSLTPLYFATVLDRLWVPAYAKIQHDSTQLVAMVAKTIRFNMLTVFPTTLVLVVFADEITHDLFGDAWLPGVFLLYAYGVAGVLSAIGFPINSAFIARGQTNVTFWLSAAWAIITWTAGAALTSLFGLRGWAGAYVLVQVPYLFIFRYFARTFDFHFGALVIPPLLMTSVIGILGVAAKGFLPFTHFLWVPGALILLLIYFGGLHVVFEDAFWSESREVARHLSLGSAAQR